MKLNGIFKLGVILLGTLSSTGKLEAIEPWASDKLPVTHGLELWLDASRENAARSGKLPLVMHERPLDIWHDASGNKRDLQQPVPGLRPKLVQTPGGFAVRFDGKDDFLSSSGLAKSVKFGTIFLRIEPKSNPGNMRGLLAFNAVGRNDYETGLNVDFGPPKSERLDFINIEGPGFVGIHNFVSHPAPLVAPHTIAISLADPESGLQLRVDGIFQGTRQRTDATLALDEFTVGARHFSNEKEPPFAQGFFDGNIAEILVYTNVLGVNEREQVEKYLAAKYIAPESGDRTLTVLTAVTNPPPVQMFVPGFTVRELPLTLSNINCIKYRSDGKVVALGYDGNIWLLSDSDGDGLEDKATPFWNKPGLASPIGMALTPPHYAKGEGLFIPAKGKISLIVDTNRDDIADQEIVVSQGWKGIWHSVDAMGIAVDKEANIYFGLGTANYTDGYLVDKATGKSQYDLKNERGTILKISSDFNRREIFCTGIRFSVAMAFNKAGDLFCTDQEGATWLPNGNPFDELLHIQPGRHYGFPPKHPKHLPSVIDEPSVYDYAPQHQSTCGLNFNEPVNGGPTFGPAWWSGDALVAGYSRGKLWRTKLIKTSSGYVAQNQLIAGLNMLTVDACVSPQGDLLVSCHSGQPDWGSGPNGTGKLYKISYSDKAAPQPVLIWPASETETRVEFDRPLDAAQLKDVTKQIKVVQGHSVAAGDQFEVLRPGYQVVLNQMAEPRYELKVFSAVLEAGGRTLAIRTPPRTHAVSYAITLPDFGNSQRKTPTKSELPQHPIIDLACDLTGVEALWKSSDAKETWSGWLPHLDLNVNRSFTEGSQTHEELFQLLKKSGRLSLRGQLDLWQMLRAATQPGSKLDFEYPPETVTVVLKSSSPVHVAATDAKIEQINDHEAHLTVTPKKEAWLPIEISLSTSPGSDSGLETSWFTAEDNRPRALPLRRIFLPWAKPQETESKIERERSIPEIAGGHWLHGKRLFFGEQLGCYKCHAIGGEGGHVGPDLSNLVYRDYPSVMKDIRFPSAAINPDHVAYNVELADGESLSGVLGNSGADEVVITDSSGRATHIPRKNISSMKPSPISLMPEGLLDRLSPQEMKDLFTFLLMPPPLKPAEFAMPVGSEPPAPRKHAEVASLWQSQPETQKSTASSRPLRLVLCSGPKDHGPGEHDYPLWQQRWSKLLSLTDHVSVETSTNWPSADQFSKADVIIFYSNNPEWSAGKAPVLDSFLNRGGGLVYIHYAVDGHEHCDELAKRIGMAWRGGGSKFRHGPLDLQIAEHTITKGFGNLKLIDESYWQLVGNESGLQVLARGVEENSSQPLIWTREQGQGRVFVSIPGHFTWTFDDPLFRILLLRGIAWAAHEPVDRFSELATVGARIAE